MKTKHTRIIVKYHLWIPVLGALFIVLFLIPAYLSQQHLIPPVKIKGTFIREGNRIFYRFISNIKHSKSILVLGTSETNLNLKGKNYWGLLNNDSTFARRMCVLGGAGRCVYTYFPLFLQNPEAVKELNVLVYINPTYWRVGLNNFNVEYYQRYVDIRLIKKIRREAKVTGLYDQFMKAADDPAMHTTLLEKISDKMDDYRSFFYYDMRRYLTTKYGFRDPCDYSDEHDVCLDSINLKYNASESFLQNNGNAFFTIDTNSTFQSDMLKTFIGLCKKYSIHAVFCLGPYNSIYCQKRNPELINNHENALCNIRKLIREEQVSLIDASDLSYVTGTFIDQQHLSEYGALLIAEKIKNHYEKNR